MSFLTVPAHDDIAPVPAFTSVDEVSEDLLDPAPEHEGDDSALAQHPAGIPERQLSGLHSLASGPLPLPARARVVPLRRKLKRGMHGKDVIATKRALSHAGYLRWPKRWTLLAGPFWRQAVKQFQRKHGLHISGVYNLETHRKLVSLGHFDKWGALLMASAPRETGAQHLAARDRVEAYALYWYHTRDRMFYTQTAQRMSIVRRRIRTIPWLGTLYEDCSSFATGVYFEAQLPDPNNRGYDGQGYTGTLAQHGTQTVHLQAADLNFYGQMPFRHVTVTVGTSGTRCVSMGSNAGPFLLPVRYRGDYHYSRSYL